MSVTILLRVTAVLEAGSGLALLVVPSLPSELLLGETPQAGLPVVLARFVGALMFSLAIACWLARTDANSAAAGGVVKAALFYDFAAAVLLVYAREGPRLAGILLWPAVVLHAVLAALLAMAWIKRQPAR